MGSNWKQREVRSGPIPIHEERVTTSTAMSSLRYMETLRVMEVANVNTILHARHFLNLGHISMAQEILDAELSDAISEFDDDDDTGIFPFFTDP